MFQAGKGALPDDISRADAKLVKGPHVLQVVTCDDVAHPSRGVEDRSKPRQILCTRSLPVNGCACIVFPRQLSMLNSRSLVVTGKYWNVQMQVRTGQIEIMQAAVNADVYSHFVG